MKTFKNILWVTDGKNVDKKGLSRLLTVVKNNDARITLIDVIDETPPEFSLLSNNIATTAKARKDLQNIQVSNSQSTLKNIVGKLEKTGIRANAKVLKGKEFVEIIRRTLRHKHDLVIKNVENSKKTGFLSMGNEDNQLMRNCPCPVLIMKPKVREDYPLLLAAVDPDPLNPERNDLNHLILRHTLSLERSFKKCEIHIVNVWNFHGNFLPNSKTKILGYREKRRRMELIEDMIDNYEGYKDRPTVHILKGDPKTIIPKLAKDLDAGVVVMGTICRTGIPGLVIGNTAESVLSKLNCSILAIKPAGFVSSVTLKKIKHY